jgi:hypothetical protein
LGVTVFFSCKMCWIEDVIKANIRGVEGSNILRLRNDEWLDGVICKNLGCLLFRVGGIGVIWFALVRIL